MEREAILARAIASERNAWLSLYTAAVAHEVRTPLQYLKVLLSIADKTKDLTQLLADIPKALQKIGAIEAVLTDMMRCYSAKDIVFASVNLNDMVRETLMRHATTAEERGVTLRTTLSEEATIVSTNRAFLDRIITNYLVNAMQALDGHKDEKIVEVTLLALSSGIVISVADSGAGIPPERASTIFTAKASTKQTGSGLGLALTAILAQRIGATVGVSGVSKLGGAAFWVEIPKVRAVGP
jgi:signal transduction histidine kinase